jgi:hypothetical protein
MDQQEIAFLRASIKQTKHMMTHLKDEALFNDYFHDEKALKDAVDQFFDLDDIEIIALYNLGYPFRGEIFFDESIIPKIIQLIPEFLLSILKQGNSFLFTVFKFQTTHPHENVKIESSNLRRISENIFYIWQNIAELEIMEAGEKKRDALSQLSSLVQFDKLYYDVLACFQMNLMSQFQYLDAMKVKVQSGDSPKIYPDTDRRKLLTQIVGYLALPIEMAELIEVSDDVTDYQSLLLQQLREAGFIKNIHTAFEQQSPKPTLADSIKQVQALQEGEYVFQRIGSVWNIKFGPEIGQFKNLKGFNYIHEVLKLYPESTRPFDLDAGKYKAIADEGIMIGQNEMDSISAGDGENADDQHKSYHKKSDSPNTELAQAKEIKRQIRTMQQSLDLIAEDSPQYFSKKRQLDEAQKFYNNNYTYTGRERMDDKNPDRARTAVTKAITRAKRELQYVMPEFFAHLDRHFKTGSDIQYSIQEDSVPDWLL